MATWGPGRKLGGPRCAFSPLLLSVAPARQIQVGPPTLVAEFPLVKYTCYPWVGLVIYRANLMRNSLSRWWGIVKELVTQAYAISKSWCNFSDIDNRGNIYSWLLTKLLMLKCWPYLRFIGILMICVHPHGYSFLISFLNAYFQGNARVLLLFILLIFIFTSQNTN